MNNRVVKKINNILLNFDKNKAEGDYELLYYQKIEKKLKRYIGKEVNRYTCQEPLLLILMAEKLEETNLLSLIKLLYEGNKNFYCIDILNQKNKNGENFIQVAIKSGYSSSFIISILETFCNKKEKVLVDCNTVDNDGNTIIHTILKFRKLPIPNDNALSFFFDADTLNVLLNKTNFDLSKHADSVFELANSIFEPILAYDNAFDKVVIKGILTLLYSDHFIHFMNLLTDDKNENIKLIDKNLSFENTTLYTVPTSEVYKIANKNQLLYLCINKKYEDEELVLKSIKRLIETGIVDVNILKNDLDIISIAINNGYSDVFILKLINELVNYNFDKKYFYQIMYSSIYTSPIYRDVYYIYKRLCYHGFNLVNEKTIIDKSKLKLDWTYTYKSLEELERKCRLFVPTDKSEFVRRNGLEVIARENEIAQFLKSLIYHLELLGCKYSVQSIKDYDYPYRMYKNVKRVLDDMYSSTNKSINLYKLIANIIYKKQSENINFIETNINSNDLTYAINYIIMNYIQHKKTIEDEYVNDISNKKIIIDNFYSNKMYIKKLGS